MTLIYAIMVTLYSSFVVHVIYACFSKKKKKKNCAKI